MTTNDRLDRVMSSWLHEDADFRVPDHLDEVLQATRVTRQRPAWSSFERWLPVDTTFRPRLFTVPRPGRLLLVAALVLLVLAIAILAAGSQRRLPPPFGLARNGDLVTSRDGDIYLIDRATQQSRLLSIGDGFDFSPIFSRDGTKMVYLHSDGPLTEPAMLTLYVANADGSASRPLTPPTKSLDWFDWSPTGDRIAYMASNSLWVVGLDANEPTRLLGTGPVHFPTWLPPDGKDIMYRLETARPGVFAIAADGTGMRRPLSTTPANNEFDYQAIAVSPDGSKITFTRWSEVGVPRVYALDVRTGTEMLFPTMAGTGQRGTAVYSPDMKLVAYARVHHLEGQFQIVVANADGSGNERTIGPKRSGPRDGSDIAAAWAFSPDGSALLVRYGNDEDAATQLLPLDGSPGTNLGSGGFEFADMQRLAP
jgi:Tol biopolymer transport system component